MRVCVRAHVKASLKGNIEMFIVCVTDTQPKECKGVLKENNVCYNCVLV